MIGFEFQDCESWSPGEDGGNPVTTEERRSSLCCRRILARAIARAASVIAAPAASNTTATNNSAEIWFIPTLEYWVRQPVLKCLEYPPGSGTPHVKKLDSFCLLV